MSKKGFTLAEVLVVIFILGIIAAETIPTILNTYQEKTRKTSIKQKYSDFMRVTNLLINDNDSLVNLFGDDDGLRDEYLNYMKYTKKCPSNTESDECYHLWEDLSYLNGDPPAGADPQWESRAIMIDGMLVTFNLYNDDCTKDVGFGEEVCASSFIDVNGFSGPNTYGKDIFGLWITKTGVKPHGYPGDTYYDEASNCKQDSTGYGCMVKVLKNEDY